MASNIIGIMGKAGAGKDTFAARLVEQHGYTRVAFADPLKALALAVDPLVTITPEHGGLTLHLSEVLDTLGWDDAKQIRSIRELLQKLGGAVRQEIGTDAWLWPAMRKVASTPGPVVITDVRYRNECEWVSSIGHLVRIDRPEQVYTDTHPSENEWTIAIPNHVVTNKGAISDLQTTADHLARYFHYTLVSS